MVGRIYGSYYRYYNCIRIVPLTQSYSSERTIRLEKYDTWLECGSSIVFTHTTLEIHPTRL